MLKVERRKELEHQLEEQYKILADFENLSSFTIDPLQKSEYDYKKSKVWENIKNIEEQLEGEDPLKLIPIPPSPYQGLFAFKEENAAFFFGRETVTNQLLETIYQKSLVAVVGPSGSGKSSVVFAGLLPRLRYRNNWLISSFRPGDHPFRPLAAALLPLLEPEMTETGRLIELNRLADGLKQGDVSLGDIVGRILQKNPTAERLLLVTDQFEELYTLCHDDSERQRFLDCLLEVLNAKSSNLRLIFTLRADFFGHALSYRPMADILQQSLLSLGPMNQEELQAAIEQPAYKLHVEIEEGLTKLILQALHAQPGNLPLLEFALTLLWEKQKDGKLTHAAYEEIGGVEKALANHAEEVFKAFSQEEQQLAQRVFVQLVQPGEGTTDTRRVATHSQIGEKNWEIVDELADARLVVSGVSETNQEETVEVIHEALIVNWQRLKEWVAADRRFRTWQERLRASLEEWKNSGNDNGALLRGVVLAGAEGWLKEREADLSKAEVEFIQKSIALRDAEKQAQENLQKTKERNIRIGITAALVSLAVVSLLALFSIIQWSTADDQRKRSDENGRLLDAQRKLALSGQLSALSYNYFDNQPDLGLLLSLESNRLADTVEGRGSLLDGLENNPHLTTVLGNHESAVYGVALSPDGKIAASGSEDGKIKLWDMTTHKAIGQPMTGHTTVVRAVAFSPDGKTLASVSEDKTVRLWNVATQQPLGSALTNHSDKVYCVAFSPDSKLMATGSADNNIIIWDVASRQPLKTLSGHTMVVRGVTFSPDGKMLASTSADTTVRLWDVASWQPIGQPMKGHTDKVYGVSFSPDGKLLATSSDDLTVRLWDVATQQPSGNPLTGHRGGVLDVKFSPDGKTLASGSVDQTILIWNVENSKVTSSPFVLKGHTNFVRSLAFSPDSKTLISGSPDGTVVLWDIQFEGRADLREYERRLTTRLNGHQSGVNSVVFSPNSKILASASGDDRPNRGTGGDNSIRLWDAVTGQALGQPLTGHQSSVNSVAFSPDGKILASGSGSLLTKDGDNSVRLWNVDTRQPLATLTGHKNSVNSVAFSPDGKYLASASSDNTIILWDVASRQPLATLTGHADAVLTIAFSPDSKLLASGSKDENLIFWNVASRQMVGQPLHVHRYAINSVVFSPDGSTLASASYDQNILLWDVASQKVKGHPFVGHRGSVNGVAFSPDNKFLITGSDDRSVLVWSIATGETVSLPLNGHSDTVTSVAFSPDGLRGASASSDKTILIWNTSLDSWKERACQIANRNLSQSEWERFLKGEPYRKTCGDIS